MEKIDRFEHWTEEGIKRILQQKRLNMQMILKIDWNIFVVSFVLKKRL